MTETSRAHLLLVLHMHQPFYYDPVEDMYRLPWVRLHAVREYYDVITLAMRHAEARLTINLVPSLLLQLQDTAKNPYKDYFWRLSSVTPRDLMEEEKKFILTNFFLANWSKMIFPLPRYKELLDLRGHETEKLDWDEVLPRFGNQDILDLQVLFNLVWLGFTAEEEFPEIGQLRRKGRNFTIEERRRVLDIQSEILLRVLDRYREAAKTGRIELSTTPAYHPIVPLLFDNNFARRCDPGTPLPANPFKYPADAVAQIHKGVTMFEDIMKFKPAGMWPSEGSVCPEMLPAVHDAGLQWLATDEEVLRTSLPGRPREEIIYRPWRAVYQGVSKNMIFRDKHLSDLIGFTYSRNPADAAVHHFVGLVEDIARRDPHAQISVILDGENPWEHYENGGRDFMNRLFDRLGASDLVDMATVSQSLQERPPMGTFEGLHTASWINNNFRVWIGGHEENTAWTYLSRVRAAVEAVADKTTDSFARAMESMYAAEGSDWFWWYGETFSSETPELFDQLFRAHLTSVYKHLGLSTPDFLSIPVLTDKGEGPVLSCIEYIHPNIDGRVTSYYEWHGAGDVDLSGAGGGGVGGAMAQASHALDRLRCGFDRDNVYLRLDFAAHSEDLISKLRSGELEIEFFFALLQKQARLIVGVDDEGAFTAVWATGTGKDEALEEVIPEVGEVMVGSILEARVPKRYFDVPPGSHVNMAVRLLRSDEKATLFELARYPRHRFFTLVIPASDFESKNWSAT